MGFFDNFPYSNFHEINLDWIIKTVRAVEIEVEKLPESIKKEIEKKFSDINIEQTLSEVLNNYGLSLSLKNYGAVADGVTDDTESFITWLTAVSSLGVSGYIPNGVYNIRSSYIAREGSKHFSIVGESETGVVIRSLLGYTVFASYSVDGYDISNLTIDMMQNKTSTEGHAIYIKDCSNCLFKNITIKNIGYSGILAYKDSVEHIKNLTFDNIKLHGIGEYNVDNIRPTGIVIADALDCHIRNCFAEYINYYSFEYKNFSDNCDLVNCKARNCFQAFYLGGDAAREEGEKYCKNIDIVNCETFDCTNPFYFGEAESIRIAECCSLMGVSNASLTGMNIRGCKNVQICGVYWYQLLGIDIRNSDSVSFSGDVFRFAGVGRAYNISNSTNVLIVINQTNVAARLTDLSATCKIVFTGVGVGSYDAPTFEKRSVQGSSITENYYTANGRIRVQYNGDAGNVVFTFFNSSGSIIGSHTISPG